MTFKKIFVYSLLLFSICTVIYSKHLDSNILECQNSLSLIASTSVVSKENQVVFRDSLIPTIASSTFVSDNDSLVYPNIHRDWRRLAYTSSIYVGTTVIAFGVLWIMPESATKWDKEAMREKGILWKWKQNVKAGPVMDKDNWIFNWVTHPYCGGIYYMTARSSGLQF